jgi:hypothetical protein
MDVALLGAEHGPTAFGLHTSHDCHGGGMFASHAVAMGHLIEAVFGCDRADLYRLKQDVVAGITSHGVVLLKLPEA